MLISLSTFFSGFRICILSSNVIIPFYFGGVLMGFSLFTTYTNFATSLAYPATAFLFYGVLNQAEFYKSHFLILMLILNFGGLIGTRLAENKKVMLKFFILVMLIIFGIWAYNVFDMELFYGWARSLLSMSLLDYLPDFWSTMVKEKLLGEQTIVKGFINYLLDSVDLPVKA
jgi:hypothetical protein